ncbi:hypothetical protein F5887DRAFT_995570 [Amanita rubescens]|nr:hypothetical protein F5887DRAFT_995570 [Amanita rubescens]
MQRLSQIVDMLVVFFSFSGIASYPDLYTSQLTTEIGRDEDGPLVTLYSLSLIEIPVDVGTIQFAVGRGEMICERWWRGRRGGGVGHFGKDAKHTQIPPLRSSFALVWMSSV